MSAAKMFLRAGCHQDDIAKAGEQAMVLVYNGRPTDSLVYLRHVRYQSKLSSSSISVKAKVLSPTSSAVQYHSYRVYLQVQECEKLGETDLLPENWGWELRQGQLMPITTDKPPAPE